VLFIWPFRKANQATSPKHVVATDKVIVIMIKNIEEEWGLDIENIPTTFSDNTNTELQ
jgi:hypothetical protein